MIVGTTIFKLGGTSNYSPQFPRGGLAATFAVDCTDVSGSPTLTITVEHKNDDDTSWSTLGTFGTITAAGQSQLDATSIKENIRFKYDFDAGDQATDAVHILMQAPSWRPY